MGTSTTTSNAEIARNPHAPEGFRAARGHLLLTGALLVQAVQPLLQTLLPFLLLLLHLGELVAGQKGLDLSQYVRSQVYGCH